MTIRALTPADADALVAFFDQLSDEDRTFIREPLRDQVFVRHLADDGTLRWIEVGDDGIGGYVSVLRLPGWSSHVGELRLVVGPNRRRTGVGGDLARRALAEALRAGMTKVVVELAADQEYAIEMFSKLGFTGEALLRDHIRDRNGELRDLVMLAHHANDEWAAMDAVGLTEELA